ncbi:hypothetical protein CHH83_19695 [Bacillus sp. 7586-K]|nr:hypothetical protein CHH83_19695 [Bacillus sp. 7586-K]
MRYFEVVDPYYALIKAENKEIARDEYIAHVANDEDGTLIDSIEEVQSDYAITKYSRTLSEDGIEIPLNEILNNIRSDINMVLIVDGNLA